MGQTLAGGVSWLSVGTGLDVPEFGALSINCGTMDGKDASTGGGIAENNKI